MRRLGPHIALLGALLALAACSTPGTRVILLPQADGRPSTVVVATTGGRETLSQPYQRATVQAGEPGGPAVDKVSAQSVEAGNKALFDLMPPPAQRFTIHFDSNGTGLTMQARRILEEALAVARARDGGEIVITGHTDTMGTVARNDELSLSRAMIVRQFFLERGLAPSRVEAVGRGERELAFPTADEVAEPRNRFVTIDVR
jgi:outer membrane protein OmpA-like peptidoglycan-associated protein